MERLTFQFSFQDLKLDVPQVERTMGYKSGESDEVLAELIGAALDEAEQVCHIKAELRIFRGVSFNGEDKTVRIEDEVFDLKKIVYSQIRKSEAVAVFLATAGDRLGIMSRQAMKEGDLLKGYVYDIIGSEVADGAAGIMQDELEKTIKAGGEKITNRYSPGYCGWNVAEQHKLFRLMPANFCGISLNDSALMSPEKSVSGFIGIGREVRFNDYTCGLCDMEDCIYRRIRKVKK
ncbi:MAG TPA: vitamin B12 dependent-methionine synthase activation domain-containing protein [Bacteroidales bacterium]|nr:vitamin B12 dependent-methionine synthase activation domain-containing protein [Bacteroidales bacterium]